MCAPQTPAQGPQNASQRFANENLEDPEEEAAAIDDSLGQHSWKDEATGWSSLPAIAATLDLDLPNQVCSPARVDSICKLDVREIYSIMH